MNKTWKTIKPKNYKNINHCIKSLKRKKYNVSVWIENIIKNKKKKFRLQKQSNFIKLKSPH